MKCIVTLGLFMVSEKSKDDALTVTVEINDRPVIMEVYTGASMTHVCVVPYTSFCVQCL